MCLTEINNVSKDLIGIPFDRKQTRRQLIVCFVKSTDYIIIVIYFMNIIMNKHNNSKELVSSSIDILNPRNNEQH